MDQAGSGAEMQWVIDKEATMERLQEHLRALTVDIGERSARRPENLKKTEEYILSFYRDLGVSAYTESYPCEDATVANVVADIIFKANPSAHFLVGAHYDSLSGTVGADPYIDNQLPG